MGLKLKVSRKRDLFFGERHRWYREEDTKDNFDYRLLVSVSSVCLTPSRYPGTTTFISKGEGTLVTTVPVVRGVTTPTSYNSRR